MNLEIDGLDYLSEAVPLGSVVFLADGRTARARIDG